MSAADEIVELTDAFYQDPHAVYRELRERGPIHRVRLDGVVGRLIVGHDAAKEAFAETGISKQIGSPEGQAVLASNGAAELFNGAINDNMLFSDPPQHTRLRKLVTKAFSGRAIRELGPRVTELADELLAGMDERVDLLDSYAFPLPIAVICELLGVPDRDKDEFRAWTAVVVDDTASIEDRTDAGIKFFTYMTQLIAARTDDPGEDLLSELIIAKEDDDRLDQNELISLLLLLLAAGHETTVNLIGNAVYEMVRDPRIERRLRSEPEAIPAYLEEILRCQGPVHLGTARFTTRPVTLGGKRIEAGEFIMISLAAANRDPARFTDPDRIDIDRPDNRHIAFGHGIHFCLGSALARMEATIAITRLLDRVPNVTLDVAEQDLRWRNSLLIRGLTRLPVRLAPAAQRIFSVA